MRFLPFALFLLAAATQFAGAAVETEVAELSFGREFEKADILATSHAPAWLTKVEQQGGTWNDEPSGWQVPVSAAEGVGRLTLTLDRQHINADLVATILFDATEATDLAVQLFDAQNRVVVVDLFGNLVDIGKEAMTDTMVIPLSKYPTAEKIVIRRIRGAVNVHGLVLFPVASQGEVANKEELEKLARVLGDPLSPENPLLKSLQNVARTTKVTIDPTLAIAKKPSDASSGKSTGKAAITKPGTLVQKALAVYPAAVAPVAGTKVPVLSSNGLVAFWNFDHGDLTDSGPNNLKGKFRGAPAMVEGIRGQALHLDGAKKEAVRMQPHPAIDPRDSFTVSAWIKYSSIAQGWGSQIVWFGDEQLGRDPLSFQLLQSGRLRLRSDRSVTGEPVFTVHDNELKLSPNGEEMPNQHVEIDSPQTLAPNTWYFVTGTIQKISPRLRSLKIFVNGDLAGEVKTAETVNYDTSKMWLNIGAVDYGNWQNFDGVIDEVRIFNRPLAPGEIRALYLQPRP